MFEELDKADTLSSKIDELLIKYEELKVQNSELKNELSSVKAQNEAKDAHINKLQEEMANKEKEHDDIFGKIEEVLGR